MYRGFSVYNKFYAVWSSSEILFSHKVTLTFELVSLKLALTQRSSLPFFVLIHTTKYYYSSFMFFKRNYLRYPIFFSLRLTHFDFVFRGCTDFYWLVLQEKELIWVKNGDQTWCSTLACRGSYRWAIRPAWNPCNRM